MNDPRGSVWRKWDLHVHTPDSLVHHYGGAGADVWDKFIEALSKLPPEFKVLGINDYIFLDGYKKVLAAKAAGHLPNIDLLLPVIELRLDKFGGSKSGLSRVNYHVIFSDEIKPDIIESQFLSALCSRYILSPEFDSLRTSGKWAAVPTRQSIEELGRLIIDSVPAEERARYHSPAIEGFNNLCLNLSAIQEVLKSHYFAGKTLAAVGKTEWADIKWNDQSIADKKTIINSADLVFISSATAAEWAKARKSLTDGGVNDRLLDCSDAHRYADSRDKDRLGKCFTWIKADPTFEGLRQSVFEYASRVHVADVPPIEPFLQIKKATLAFPTNTFLSREARSDVFCFRGTRQIAFSPYLTCIIGGRGTGKSTLLNLIHEKLDAGSTELFKRNKLTPAGTSVADSVSVEGISEKGVVEFLQQNEIEQFASDHQRLTAAIFTRLRKLDATNLLQEKEAAVDGAIAATQKQLERITTHHELSVKLSDCEKELATQKGIVESFQNTDYKRINDELAGFNKELQGLKTSKARLGKLVQDLKTLLAEYPAHNPNQAAILNSYEQQVRSVVETIEKCINEAAAHPSLAAAGTREQEVAGKAKMLRDELDKFLKARGLSEENLTDVGKATEKIAQLDEEIAALKTKVGTLQTELSQFTAQREKAEQYAKAVEAQLSPVNVALKGQGTEVKPIELQYRFDLKAFREAMIEYVAGAIGLVEGRAARPDYVDNKLRRIDFAALGDRVATVDMIPDEDGVYAKTLREFFGQAVKFETLKLQAELCLLDVQELGRICVLYDDKPVENSSFGQRCTAVIVVLLLLGNMPIVIDEPEAHLDSSLIAKYLVDLIKTRKKHRQIIFATHNANFVINGDAELIHCMSMDDTKVTEVVNTTIEDLANRELLLALEGGEEAFHQREKRYGID
jgi:ABC-type cobalamin/Fe3+-siderophores transport system ATPase subunit